MDRQSETKVLVRLRLLRLWYLGLSQERLAEHMGVSPQTMMRWLNTGGKFTADQIDRLERLVKLIRTEVAADYRHLDPKAFEKLEFDAEAARTVHVTARRVATKRARQKRHDRNPSSKRV